VIYLSKFEILRINKSMILRFGGSFFLNNNIQNNNGLEYLIEAVKATVFGYELYPGLYRKAAYYMHSIISNHIFYDGNKRTGMVTALVFLKKNYFELKTTLELSEIIEFTFKVAKGEGNIDEMEAWFAHNCTFLTSS